MMADRHSAAEFNAVVREGVTVCRQSVAPIVALAEFIDDLHATPGWNDAAVLRVETAIRRILTRMLDSHPWPADEL
jgi:hypothetical protein